VVGRSLVLVASVGAGLTACSSTASTGSQAENGVPTVPPGLTQANCATLTERDISAYFWVAGRYTGGGGHDVIVQHGGSGEVGVTYSDVSNGSGICHVISVPQHPAGTPIGVEARLMRSMSNRLIFVPQAP
jgi:NADPH:quinone reductase-like Zn-dependent oxidoreductase